MRKIKTICTICQTEVTLDFSDLSYEQAKKGILSLDRQARECPGYHVELGGWRKFWQLDDCLKRVYPNEVQSHDHHLKK